MPLAGDPLLAELAPVLRRVAGASRITVRSGTSSRSTAITASSIVAALHSGGWYDVFLGGTLHNYAGMRSRREDRGGPQGPASADRPVGSHDDRHPDPVGDYDPGVRSWYATIDYDGILLRFYDRYLRDLDNGVEDEPPVRIFVMGENRWRLENEWPLARTEFTDYFLHSDGGANTLNGDGVLSREEPGAGSRPDHYIYDPLNPVPNMGGGLCCNEAKTNGGQFDQRAVEVRPDVLCYTTEPLEAPVEVTGPVTVTLYASSSAVDTDFTAKLVDVCPCGCVHNLTDGIIRARYRNGDAQAGAADAGRGLPVRDRPLGDEQRLQGRPPDPGRDLVEQLPALRPQPEHRRRDRDDDARGVHRRPPDDPPQPGAPQPHHPADHPAVGRLRSVVIV